MGVSRLRKYDAAIELLWFFFPVFLLLWVVPAMPGNVSATWIGLMTFVLVLLLSSHTYYQETAQELGFRIDNFFAAIKLMLWPMAALICLMFAVGYGLGEPRFGARFWMAVIFGPVWGFIQQYGLQCFVNKRLQKIFGKGRLSAGLTALIFAAAHLPNPALTVATAIGGYIWARVYQKEPNLFALALTHGIGSAIFAATMPKTILKNMIVGYSYLIRP